MHFRFQAQDRPADNTNVLTLKAGERLSTAVIHSDFTYRDVAAALRKLAEWVERQIP